MPIPSQTTSSSRLNPAASSWTPSNAARGATESETAQDSISSHQHYSFLSKVTASGNPDSGRYLPSSSWAPPTPPESDGEDNDALTSTLPGRSMFHTDPYDFDVTTDALHPNLPYRSVFWQGLIHPGRAQRQRPLLSHRSVLPSSPYRSANMYFWWPSSPGRMRRAEREFISIKEPESGIFHNQRRKVKQLLTANVVGRGLHARSVIHITRPSCCDHDNNSFRIYGLLQPSSRIRLLNLYSELQRRFYQPESYHQETLLFTPLQDTI
jgi:hypothetical protein